MQWFQAFKDMREKHRISYRYEILLSRGLDLMDGGFCVTANDVNQLERILSAVHDTIERAEEFNAHTSSQPIDTEHMNKGLGHLSQAADNAYYHFMILY